MNQVFLHNIDILSMHEPTDYKVLFYNFNFF